MCYGQVPYVLHVVVPVTVPNWLEEPLKVALPDTVAMPPTLDEEPLKVALPDTIKLLLDESLKVASPARVPVLLEDPSNIQVGPGVANVHDDEL